MSRVAHITAMGNRRWSPRLPYPRHNIVHCMADPLLFSSNTKREKTTPLFICHSPFVGFLHECFDSPQAKLLQTVCSPSRILAPKEDKLGNKRWAQMDHTRIALALWGLHCMGGSQRLFLSSLPFHLPSLYSQTSLLKTYERLMHERETEPWYRLIKSSFRFLKCKNSS